MSDKDNGGGEGADFVGKWNWSWAETFMVIALVVIAGGSYAGWVWSRHERVRQLHDVELLFTQAPDTVPVAAPSRFVIQVNGPKRSPLAQRSVHLLVSPEDKAQIVSVTGPSGRDSASMNFQAWGRSDASGSISVLVRALQPGEFHLTAADSISTSAEGAAVDFIAR